MVSQKGVQKPTHLLQVNIIFYSHMYFLGTESSAFTKFLNGSWCFKRIRNKMKHCPMQFLNKPGVQHKAWSLESQLVSYPLLFLQNNNFKK
jgi:hypothetical protein